MSEFSMPETRLVGKNIRTVREHKKLEISQVSARSSIPEEELNQIENGLRDPSISELLKIATTLDTSIGILVMGKEAENLKKMVVRSQERIPVTFGKTGKKTRYESLSADEGNRHMEPFLVEIFPEKDSAWSSYPGEEFHYVLSGDIILHLDNEKLELKAGDAVYFDSSVPHRMQSRENTAKIISVVYRAPRKNFTAKPMFRSRKMDNIIQAARLIKNTSMGMVCPDVSSMVAINRALEEGILEKAYFIGCRDTIHRMVKRTINNVNRVEIVDDYPAENLEMEHINAADYGVRLVKEGKIQMLMKGNINTATFSRPVTHPRYGIGNGRRLSLVCTFDLPNVDRLIFLTDPGVNPSLLRHEKPESARDIIENAVFAARAMGVSYPKVAILDANEVPSTNVPSTLMARKIAAMPIENAVVEGPLSYDLSLYEDAVRKKRLKNSAVAGKADILVVPRIEGGNFIYKSWVMTSGAEVANIVIGARVPIILTSRSDNQSTKFLNICAGVLNAQLIHKENISNEKSGSGA